MSNRRAMGLIALVAVALVVVARLSPLAGDRESIDYELFYQPLADSIRAGDGLTVGGEPEGRYPPGYPVLLAAASILPGGNGMAVTVINAAALAATAVLAFALMLRLSSRRVALLAGFGVVTYPLIVYAAASPGTELPFVALVVAAAHLAVKAADGQPWAAALAGLAAGGAALIRPVGVGVAVVLVVVLMLWRRDRSGLVAAALLAGLALVTVAPWEIWLRQQHPAVVVPADVGVSTSLSGLTINGRDEAGGNTVPVPASVDDLGRRALAQHRTIRTTGELRRFVADEFERSPPTVVALLGIKSVRSWYGTDSLQHEGLILLVQIPYLLLAGLGLWIARRDRVAGLAVALIAYFWLTAVLAVSIVRYMLPAMVFVVVLAAIGADRMLSGEKVSS